MKTSTTIFNSTYKVQIHNISTLIVSDIPELIEHEEMQVMSLQHVICKLKKELNDIEDALHGGNYCKAQRELYDVAVKTPAWYIQSLNKGLFVCPQSRSEI